MKERMRKPPHSVEDKTSTTFAIVITASAADANYYDDDDDDDDDDECCDCYDGGGDNYCCCYYCHFVSGTSALFCRPLRIGSCSCVRSGRCYGHTSRHLFLWLMCLGACLIPIAVA